MKTVAEVIAHLQTLDPNLPMMRDVDDRGDPDDYVEVDLTRIAVTTLDEDRLERINRSIIRWGGDPIPATFVVI
jgi:hypothetical protein